MEWTSDVSAGDWIRERTDDPWRGTMHDVVPRGFPAYARVFHPATRDRPVGRAWPELPYAANARAWREFQAASPEIDHERVSWADTATAFGRRMHATAQWDRLVGTDRYAGDREDGPRDAAGWRYAEPAAGALDADLLTAVAEHLAPHTTTPGDGFVALWEGWGGLVGFLGEMPARTLLTFTADETADPDEARHNAMLGRSIHDPFNNVFRKPSWQPGILSDEISKGARLELPGRSHLLFRGGAAELADPDWVLRVPWRDRELETHGFPPSAQSPNLVWPDDRAWVLVTEVDFDSTIVGGSGELIRAICADPRLEALPLREGTSLQWDADALNRG